MENKQFFDTDRLITTYFRQSLPVVFSMVITLVYNLADTYFIARTNNAALVAGVSLCGPLFTMLMAVGNIFGQGGSSLIARMLGSGDRNSAARISAYCFYGAILAGISLAVPLVCFRFPCLKLLGANAQTLPYAEAYYIVLALASPAAFQSASKRGTFRPVRHRDDRRIRPQHYPGSDLDHGARLGSNGRCHRHRTRVYPYRCPVSFHRKKEKHMPFDGHKGGTCQP